MSNIHKNFLQLATALSRFPAAGRDPTFQNRSDSPLARDLYVQAYIAAWNVAQSDSQGPFADSLREVARRVIHSLRFFRAVFIHPNDLYLDLDSGEAFRTPDQLGFGSWTPGVVPMVDDAIQHLVLQCGEEVERYEASRLGGRPAMPRARYLDLLGEFEEGRTQWRSAADFARQTGRNAATVRAHLKRARAIRMQGDI